MEKPQPFAIDIPEADLEDLRFRLLRTRWPMDLDNAQWRYGVSRAYLEDLVGYWIDGYDWRAQEAAMNGFSHFRVKLDDIPIHFIHERGKGPAPMPLILTHGWPSTFWDLRKLIRPLADPAAFGGDPADAFDVVVPSLPGFGFSTPLTMTGVSAFTTADLWVRLMREVLGYETFAAQGNDWGNNVCKQLGHKYARYLHGIHITGYSPTSWGVPDPTPLTSEDFGPEEAGWFDRHQAGMRRATYIPVHNGNPQSLAYAMNDSPAGMAAWLLERRRHPGDFSAGIENVFTRDDQITNVMLYWLTGSFVSAARFYYEQSHASEGPSHDRRPTVEAPTAFGILPRDAVATPRKWAERDTNLQRWTVYSGGGHYGVYEVADEFVDDLRAFFRPMR